MGRKIISLPILALGLLFAQGERGTFNGTVADASGAAKRNRKSHEYRNER